MKRYFCGMISVLLVLFLLCACGTSGSKPGFSEHPTQGVSRATLAAVGDIRFTDEMLQTLHAADDFTALFGNTIGELAAADLAIGNLEGNFAGAPYENGSYPDELASVLSGAGFDLIQTANSYSLQNGLAGLRRTKTVLEAAQLTALGTYSTKDEAGNRVVLREVNGIRFAFIAFTKGLNGMSMPSGAEYCTNVLYTDYNGNYSRVDTEGIVRVVEQARAFAPDFIIAALHWGSEDSDEISKTQTQIADLLVASGVDVILGSHTHRVGKLEQRTVTSSTGAQKQVVIAYGLGDYCCTTEGGLTPSVILKLEFTRNNETGETAVADVSYTSVATVDFGAEAKQRYGVLGIEDAIALYENNYYNRVSETQYEALLKQRDKIKDALFPPEAEK